MTSDIFWSDDCCDAKLNCKVWDFAKWFQPCGWQRSRRTYLRRVLILMMSRPETYVAMRIGERGRQPSWQTDFPVHPWHCKDRKQNSQHEHCMIIANLTCQEHQAIFGQVWVVRHVLVSRIGSLLQFQFQAIHIHSVQSRQKDRIDSLNCTNHHTLRLAFWMELPWRCKTRKARWGVHMWDGV